MKRTNLCIFAALALLFGLTACMQSKLLTDELLPEDSESTPVVFTATVYGDWNGVTTSVAVKIDDTVKEYSVTANADDYMRATLSSDDPHYWTGSNDITVTAWWPYTEGDTTPPTYVVVNADQSTSDGFNGSNFISAEGQTVTYSSSPTLTFIHRTARVTVNLTDYTEGLKSVKLAGLSTVNGNPPDIIPYEYDKENFTYVALVAPQTVTQGTVFISCEFENGNTYDYKMQGTAEWEADVEYIYTVSLAEAAPDYTYDKATGTYTVYTPNGLLVWNKAVQDTLSLNCTLAADIDLTDINYEWLLVGNSSSQYTGTFDGGDHTITGLTINEEEAEYVGLIGCLGSDGKVQNLTLEKIDISCGTFQIGGVVGWNIGTVTACTVSGSVSGDDGTSRYVGGVVGFNSGTVIACTSSGSVLGGTSCGGGVVGSNYGTMIACYNSGNVSGNSYYAGGVVGWNNSSSTVTACYHSSGSISGSQYIGGVIGWNASGTVTSCYWSDYDGKGISGGKTNSGTTKVDGDEVTWSDAVGQMNQAIDTWNDKNSTKQCNWQYELTGSLPTLKKNE